MKKRPARTKTKTAKKAPPPPPPSDKSTAQEEARIAVDKLYPSYDFRLLAETASRMVPAGKSISRKDGMAIARNALNLLDGVQDTLSEREKSRADILAGLSARAEIPEHLGWAAGKKFILGTDGGGSEEKFYDFLKYRLRWERLQELRAKLLQAGQPEPELNDVPAITPAELTRTVKRFHEEGFSRFCLEDYSKSYAYWRTTVDGRRMKK
jgi:hypothetical protein